MNDNNTSDLFRGYEGGLAIARNSDPVTSHMAAEAVSEKVTRVRAEVLAYARQCGSAGFTDVALNEHFGTTASTYRSRRRELVELNLIEDTGETVLLGTSRRAHKVWRVTERGSLVMLAA